MAGSCARATALTHLATHTLVGGGWRSRSALSVPHSSVCPTQCASLSVPRSVCLTQCASLISAPHSVCLTHQCDPLSAPHSVCLTHCDPLMASLSVPHSVCLSHQCAHPQCAPLSLPHHSVSEGGGGACRQAAGHMLSHALVMAGTTSLLNGARPQPGPGAARVWGLGQSLGAQSGFAVRSLIFVCLGAP